MRIPSIALFVSLLISIPLRVSAEFVVSHLPNNMHSGHENYNNALLLLALEKTRATYGDYSFVETPFYDIKRRLFATEQNLHPNFLMELSYDAELLASDKITFINFPVDLGIMGYRICFVDPLKKDAIARTTSLESLRHYMIGQGVAWADTKILRHNGFKVVEVAELESLFKMTARSRIDLFCRGISELKNEFFDHQQLPSLTVDESFILYYPFPRFFFINKENKLAKERIETGLKLAYADGSLQKLLLEYHQTSIEFAKLKKRKLFELENPLLKNLPEDYKRYLVDWVKE